MKTIIAGSRDLKWVNGEYIRHIYRHVCTWTISEVVSGGARGVDLAGEEFAMFCGGMVIKRFLPDWSKGKSAGNLRNIEMAEYADALIAIWDGRSKGTAHMIREMERRGKPYLVIVHGNHAEARGRVGK